MILLPSLGAPEFLCPCSAHIPPTASDQECAAGSSRHLRDEAGRRSHSESSRTVTPHIRWGLRKAPHTKACSVLSRDEHENSAESIHLNDSRHTSNSAVDDCIRVFGNLVQKKK